MSEIRHDNNNNTPSTLHISGAQGKQTHFPTPIDTVFQRLAARDVEQFYKSYHFWLLQRRIETLHTEIAAIKQAITDNATLMQPVHPSAIALASLAQLQASGVDDLDLLDRMLARGDTWLDHTMQLLERCEKLDVIRGDYTQWCEHALEGAYDWIESMNAANTINSPENQTDNAAASVALNDAQHTELQNTTEEQLLQKLMSDEDATEKMAALHLLNETEQEVIDPSLPTRKITQPLEEVIDPSLPVRKITQPLEQEEVPVETEREADSNISDRATTGPQIEHSEQIDEMKDIVEVPEEEKNQVSSVQGVTINTSQVETASKDADIDTVEAVPEGIAVSEETSDQASADSVGMLENQHKSQKMQRQKHGLRGFWRFLFWLLALFHRKS